MIAHPEPDILECEVKWALGRTNMNKARRGDGIPGELFQIPKDDAVKVLHSIYQQIWTTRQWHRTGKGQFSFQSQRKAVPKNVQTTTQLHSFHMLAESCSKLSKLGFSVAYGKESTRSVGNLGLIPWLGRSPWGEHGNPLQYSCLENPMDRGAWQAKSMGSQRVGHGWVTKHRKGFNSAWTETSRRNARGTRDQISNIHWIIEKTREFQKKSTSASLTMLNPLTVWIAANCGKFL